MSMTVFSSTESLPPEALLADCCLSGGRLEDYLRRLRGLETGPVCVRLDYTAMDFLLPCPSGTGKPLSRTEALERSRGYPLHFSAALCTCYCTQWDGEQLHVILTDTPDTIEKKYRLLRQLDFPMVLVESTELRQLLALQTQTG